CVLDHNDDAVLYDEAEIFSVPLDDIIAIDELHAPTDAGVFIDNTAPDRRVRADTERYSPTLAPLQAVFPPLLRLTPPQQSIIDQASRFAAGANPNNRALHGAFFQYASLAQHRFGHLAIEEFSGWQITRSGVDRRFFIIETERRIGLLGERQISIVKRFD